MITTQNLYWSAAISYLVLVIVLSSWLYLSLPSLKSPLIIGTLVILLLLAPVPGILKRKPYTFAWAAMLVLAYFTHSLIELYANDAMFGHALIELLASSVFITCAGLYARLRSRELKAAKSAV